MKVKIINSGSDGNAYLITDKNNNQLLIECGVKIKNLMLNCDFNFLECCIVSHEHKDHNLSKESLEKYGIKVLTDFTVGKWERTKSFKILPMRSNHNVKCFSFIIYVISENKTILFATDTKEIDPQTPDIDYDLAMLECNYFGKYINELSESDSCNNGYKNHMSAENLFKWINSRRNKPKSLCLIHLSNSGHLGNLDLNKRFKSLSDNLFIAKRNLIMEI